MRCHVPEDQTQARYPTSGSGQFPEFQLRRVLSKPLAELPIRTPA
jgi:hypothetical protein